MNKCSPLGNSAGIICYKTKGLDMNKDQINKKLIRGEIMEVSSTDRKTLEIMASLEKKLKLVREIKNDDSLGFKILYRLVK